MSEEMPILATHNIKDIINTTEFIIEEIKGDSLKVNDFWFEKNEVAHSFMPVLILCNSLQIPRSCY